MTPFACCVQNELSTQRGIELHSDITDLSVVGQLDGEGRLLPREHGLGVVLVDRDLVVSESPAIVTYLAETYCSDATHLIPETPWARARYFEWISFISMELDATSLYVLRRHVDLHETYGEAPAANNTAREYFLRMIQSAVPALPSKGDFLLGQDFSGADILMISCLNFSDRFDFTLPAEITAYRERVSARPPYQAALKATTP